MYDDLRAAAEPAAAVRGSFVSILMSRTRRSSRISIRSSASFAASAVAALAVFSATTSTVLPVDGLDLNLAVDVADFDAAARRQAHRSSATRRSRECLRSAVTMSQP